MFQNAIIDLTPDKKNYKSRDPKRFYIFVVVDFSTNNHFFQQTSAQSIIQSVFL